MSGPKKCCDNPLRCMGLVDGDPQGIMVANWYCANCGAHWIEECVTEKVEKDGLTILIPVPVERN